MLVHDKSVPLYLQLKELIKQEIKKGNLKPTDRLPSEKELCNIYKVSRITVRQALAALDNEGLIYRSHGKGTFVATPGVDQELITVTPFEETLHRKGIKPSTKCLSCHIISADFNLATILAIPLQSNIAHVCLLGLGDDEPLVIYNSYFPQAIGQEMMALVQEKIQKGHSFSTYDLYKNISTVTPAMLTQSFESIVADKSTAKILNIKPGHPLLQVTTIVYTADGRPTEYRIAAYRGEKYRFHITRPAGSHFSNN
ncbi:GntR family transcriptional regulator [Desulfotomaculum arcticum]|uniref:GntR family transcriptional regulator n=1 Tax=Desulfotruncus arcticus DSM 17038 TaxID=1121424 RepID=A0A1I2WXL4_9FIRM|nr:GntR family transcriptional regulator [Desulfotruncus arcticus]SFH05932.1 GntR family transcriptional regulator [Desulfotomaculum arcticum] [Desulfotruncus arcticus DSM 17038]